ncbi:Abi family protein [Nocardia puris]|uniref:Abortive infection bacteriophage resistance protein n=1 Tax=Nocardia puris TaxID=208602 RepID=A0A366DMW7_9NOCA|nr:Abi family protein [Nocardia puris]RBO91421.1 abortive infection bacteriophage resistance protein [Nocardia puris]
MTTYDKPFKTLAEQVELLSDRGMDIPDRRSAIDTLRRIGYYRLSGYWYIFRAPSADSAQTEPGDLFLPGTTFDRVLALYEFDRRLRLHVLDALERVEVALRVQLGYTLGAGHAFAHLDPAVFDSSFTRVVGTNPIAGNGLWLESEHVKWLTNVRNLEKRSKEEFVDHFKRKYGMPLPIWVVTELLTFGGLATVLGGMKPQQKNIIAAGFGVYDANCDGDGAAFAKWVTHLSYVRNTCAHHVRLWNKNMTDQLSRLEVVPDLAHAAGVRSVSRIYPSLAVLAYLTCQLDRGSRWRVRTVELIRSGLAEAGQPDGRIGCPPGWEEQPIWTEGYVPPPDPLLAEHRELLQRFECVGTSDVGLVIDTRANSKRRTSAVRYARSHSRLLGFPVGSTYRFPVFQLDKTEGCIKPVAEYANSKLNAKEEPWRTGRWWSSPNAYLDGATPMAALNGGVLTEAVVDGAMPVDHVT